MVLRLCRCYKFTSSCPVSVSDPTPRQLEGRRACPFPRLQPRGAECSPWSCGWSGPPAPPAPRLAPARVHFISGTCFAILMGGGPLGPARISGCVFCLLSGVESTSSCWVRVGFSPTTCRVHVLRLPSGSHRSFSTFSSCSSHTFLVWFISCIFSGRWEHLILWGRENRCLCSVCWF